jgi:hypothetical protein
MGKFGNTVKAIGKGVLGIANEEPDVVEPAERPERNVELEGDDILLGGVDENLTDSKALGKRSLLKPSGGKPKSGLNT